MSGVGGLRRFARPAAPSRAVAALPFPLSSAKPPGEGCEMCGEDIGDEHSHVVDVDSRRLLCTCRPCYLLFTQQGAGRGNYRAVPDRYLVDPRFRIDEVRWEQLQVPVAIAFFFHNSVQGRVVSHYPSPAGATESLLDLTAWDVIVADNPLAAALVPDVEALVVRRSGGRTDAYLVPIDRCYELVGRMRLHWKGFDGGPEATREIDDFFTDLGQRSRVLELTPDG